MAEQQPQALATERLVLEFRVAYEIPLGMSYEATEARAHAIAEELELPLKNWWVV